MHAPSLFALFTEPLNGLGLSYMVTGSVAGTVYGEPRLTHDVDLVLEVALARASELVAAFPLEDFYCPPEEVIVLEGSRAMRGHFNIIHRETGFKADIYVVGKDPLHHWGMARRRQIMLPEGAVWVAPPEYVIVRKMEYLREGGSPKHVTDIQGVLRHTSICWQDLHRWLIDRCLLDLWKEHDLPPDTGE